MFYFIIFNGVILTHFMFYIFYNYAHVFLWVLQTYSRIQMNLPKKVMDKIEDGLECLVEDRIIKYTVKNALDKINESDVAVLVSDKNMILFYPPIDSYFPEYEQSNVRFISVTITIYPELSVNEEIKLKTSEYSFYVVDNELNVDFVRYYFLKFKNVLLPYDVEYTMTVVDDNVTFHTLDQNECIAFEKNSYQIFTYKNEQEEEEGEEEEGVGDEVEKGEGEEQEERDQEEEEEEEEYPNSRTYTIVPTCEDVDESFNIDHLIQIEEDMMNENVETLVDKFTSEYDDAYECVF